MKRQKIIIGTETTKEQAEATKVYTEAMQKKEASEGGNNPRPPGWKPWKKIDKAEVDREVLFKTRHPQPERVIFWGGRNVLRY